MGLQFYIFVEAAKNTTEGPLPMRPPGIEGYLPISGLMGLVDWMHQGVINNIHPAATILFLFFIVISFILRKSFCGWICPVGLISESLARIGQLIFKRNFRLPKFLDIPLRSIKYLLLGFFVWAILTMSAEALNSFITSPYNMVSDVKMMEFFTDMSTTVLIVISILAVISIFVNGFWCRYACPYGALMGVVAWLSPVKVRREASTCTDCGICDKVCPARLDISHKPSVGSVECIGCTDCVVSCPVPNTLSYGTKEKAFTVRAVGMMIVVLFTLVVIVSRIAGVWDNGLTDDDMRHHVARMHTSEYGHPGMEK
jgi:polyferredoxin